MIREVKGVKWVKEWEGRPAGIPVGRPRGVKREGVRFEERVLPLLPKGTRRGVWFEYEDSGGRGFAQVDFLIPAGGDRVVVAEAKRTWKPEAYVQLRKLYFPLLKWFYGPRFLGGILLCRNLTWESPRREVAEDLDEAVKWVGFGTCEGLIPVVHFAVDVGEVRSRKPTKPRYPATAPSR